MKLKWDKLSDNNWITYVPNSNPLQKGDEILIIYQKDDHNSSKKCYDIVLNEEAVGSSNTLPSAKIKAKKIADKIIKNHLKYYTDLNTDYLLK